MTPVCYDCGRPGDELDALLLEVLAPLGVVLECADCGCAMADVTELEPVRIHDDGQEADAHPC